MRELLIFRWSRCRQGYEIQTRRNASTKPNDFQNVADEITKNENRVLRVRSLQRSGVGEEKVLVPKSAEFDPIMPFEIPTTERVLFHIFADTAPTEDGCLEFATRFGLLHSEGEYPEDLEGWGLEIKRMRRAVEAWTRGDRATILDEFNMNSFTWADIGVALEPGARNGDPLQRRDQPRTLLAAMWVQMLYAVTTAMQIRHCAFCRTPFAFGPGTGRTSKAHYCTKKCQQAHAYRKRQEAKE